ncbi:MAG: hypothetical protein LBU34_10880, partial [Planctomycetaceae bacterium]|nr:hypothetical protein [Planctomycetaceae bacterium]
MTMLYKQMLRQNLFEIIMILTFLTITALTGYAEQQPISPEKAKLMGYVEDFLMHNFRDVTMRKSLEWGDVKTDDNGNNTIRYRCEALIWDKDRMILAWDFTFDKDGKFISQSKVEAKPVKIEKPDVSTTEGVKKLVEKFFSENFRDITSRKTIKWGELEKSENGNVSIVYRYEAMIWNKDKIIFEQRFTFDKDGKYLSHETIEKSLIEIEKPDVSTTEGVK